MADIDRTPVCLGIEAGATRTIAMAASAGLATPLRAVFGPANLQLLDERQLASHLRTIARAMPRPDAIGIGMAGARTDADHERIRRAAARVWPGVPCHATSDLETALVAAGNATSPRVLIVSGTGSCCLGKRADGGTVRLGGWGHVLGDRGSGYDIGLGALRAVVHAADHRRAWPPLGQRLLGLLALNEPEDLVQWAQAATKADIAGLAVHVFRAAGDRDPIASRVLAAAAQTLADDAAACARRVAKPGTEVHFILAGSVLLEQPRFAGAVRRAIRRTWRRAVVSALEREGVWGALALAQQRTGSGVAMSRPPALAASSCPPASSASSGLTAPSALSGPPASVPSRVPDASLEALVRSPTEQRNPRSMHLDRLSLADAIELMLQEDTRITPALLAERARIERGVRLIVRAFKHGGRLFYVGAGTSGRLGVLDASECPPTFRTPPEMVQGIIAGGQAALWSAVEGAEDDPAAGARTIGARGVTARDVVVGIAASGRTPFVWGALGEARRRGAATVLLCFNPHVTIPRGARPTLVIAPDVGPEILTGSTRLKSGTATKLVLNIFTTLAMVRLGKVRSNLMIDVKASNVKLRDRAARMVQELAGTDYASARAALEQTNWRIDAAWAALGRARR